MRQLCISLLLVSSILPIHPASSHAEHDKARYVATTGSDTGRCDSFLRPCRSIGYAATQAGKGDRILVAGGVYHIATAEELFHLTAGMVEVYGGYNRFEHYMKQSPADNPTVVAGVPAEYRKALGEKGFNVIADRKGDPAIDPEQTANLKSALAALKSSSSAVDCVGGMAGSFPCDNVSMLSHIALSGFSLNPNGGNDVWGFVDLNTEREYAIMGFRNGTAVVDVTDPENPVEIGAVSGQQANWRDIKVYQFFDTAAQRYKAYAYVTTDGATEGLVIIDLTGLPNSVSLGARRNEEASAHNVYIANVEYSTGLPLSGAAPVLHTGGANVSNGSFRAYSLDDPLSPALQAVSPSGGYMHDATSLLVGDTRKDTQCVNAVDNCEVLVDFNETSFEMWDLSSLANPQLLDSITYVNSGYTHSGWWSEDKQFIFLHDEADEQQFGLGSTLRVFSISNLANVTLAGTWTGPTNAVDHNGFVRGNRYYMSNYTRGLTVLDISDPANPVAAGRFDTHPVSDSSSFNGAWGAYPFLPSGTLLVSDVNSGLYVLRDDTLTSAAGALSFSSAVYGGVEGATVNLTVSRSGGSAGAVSIEFEAVAGSAAAADFTLAAGQLNWADGDSADKTIAIALETDAQTESPERVIVRLANPVNGAALASPSASSVFISDPGAASVVEIDDAAFSVDENAGKAFVTVARRGSAEGAVAVSFATRADTAAEGADYAAAGGTLNWADGDATARVIAVDVTDDAADETAERFAVDLSSPAGATIGTGSAQVTIADNDAPTVTPPPSPTGGSGGGGALHWIGLLLLALGLISASNSRKMNANLFSCRCLKNSSGIADV